MKAFWNIILYNKLNRKSRRMAFLEPFASSKSRPQLLKAFFAHSLREKPWGLGWQSNFLSNKARIARMKAVVNKPIKQLIFSCRLENFVFNQKIKVDFCARVHPSVIWPIWEEIVETYRIFFSKKSSSALKLLNKIKSLVYNVACATGRIKLLVKSAYETAPKSLF